jgi:hypothetical protein
MDVTQIERSPGPDDAGAERRRLARWASRNLTVWVRPKGRLRRRQAHAVDFNRYGLALLSRLPLRIDQTVLVRLHHPQLKMNSNVVGVVHNCVRHDDGYRCGIRFRVTSRQQRQGGHIETALVQLEAVLTDESR